MNPPGVKYYEKISVIVVNAVENISIKHPVLSYNN